MSNFSALCLLCKYIKQVVYLLLTIEGELTVKAAFVKFFNIK